MTEHCQWRGETWYFYRDYFRNRAGKLLHREKYQDTFGPLPPEMDVHHCDGDKLNNDITNLEAISRADHLREHGPRGFQLWDTAQRSENTSRTVWAERAWRECKCGACGRAFQTRGMRTPKFCSQVCKARDFRKRHPGYSKRYKDGPTVQIH